MKYYYKLIILMVVFNSTNSFSQSKMCDLIYYDFKTKVDFLTIEENKNHKEIDLKEELLWNSDYAEELISRFELLYPEYNIDSLYKFSNSGDVICNLNQKVRRNRSYIKYAYSKPIIDLETNAYFLMREVVFISENKLKSRSLGVELIMYRKRMDEFVKFYSVFSYP